MSYLGTNWPPAPRSAKEIAFQKKLIAHLEEQAVKGAPGAARMLELARAKLAKDNA